MSNGMNFEIYTKVSIGDCYHQNILSYDNILAQFPHYAVMQIALDSFYNVYGDNLYVRAITEDGQHIIGKLSHKAKYIISSPQHWPVQG